VSIRRRIFSTYLVLIAIIVAYFALSSLARAGRLRAESDMVSLLELRNEWNGIRIGLGAMVVNWDNGAAYRSFDASRARFGGKLAGMLAESARRPWYSAEFSSLLSGLAEIWSLADEHLDRVSAVVEDLGFRYVEEAAARRPGLQRLEPLLDELDADASSRSRAAAQLLRQLIAEVEFFPIYGDTADNVFTVLVSRMETYEGAIAAIEAVVRALFFVAFLAACLLLAKRFSDELSAPIVSTARRLNDFAGLSGASIVRPKDERARDELSLLSGTVEDLIAHYTDLAFRAGLLARGEVPEEASFPSGGIVGRSLEEISLYLRELARTSAWIKDGEYGLQIRERSDRDVITRNFNIMSSVIKEKIETLRGMFESVEEAVLVLDERGTVVEANARLRELFGGSAADEGWSAFLSGPFSASLVSAADAAPAPDAFPSLRGADGSEIPARVVARDLPESGDGLRRRMYFISDESWRARAERERDKLRSQAALAELRALRAQINPHFFFNTLNTIAHLIETNGEAAVETVERLAGLFRYTLSSTKRDLVPLGEELRHVRLFLEIESLRYGEALRTQFDVPESLSGLPVPPMLLQPLVENAVRYGADGQGLVSVTVSGELRGEDMVLEVADRGAKEVDPASLLEGHGTGLRNVNQRSVTMYGRKLYFRRNTPSGLVVGVRIPRGDA